MVSMICFGIFVLLCAPWVLSSNTPYQKFIIVFLWLPALLHLSFFSSRYKLLSRVGAGFYLFAAVWFSFVVVVHSQAASDLRELKIPLYVGLTLLGFFVVANSDLEKYKSLLLFCALLGGFGAWASWIFFHFVEGLPLLSRQPAVGLWNVIIPAAQASGALMLLLVSLAVRGPVRPMLSVGLVLSLTGYFVFLLSSQTRGVWIALFVAFAVIVFLRRSRATYMLFGGFFASLAALYFLDSKIFLARGESYRLELWASGVKCAMDNFFFGVGFEKIWLSVASIRTPFIHPHNMFIDIAIHFGFLGLLSWLLLWGWAIVRAYRFRRTALGQATLVLLVYSSVAVLTDSTVPWTKPSPWWFVSWLPLALAFSLGLEKDIVPAKADSY